MSLFELLKPSKVDGACVTCRYYEKDPNSSFFNRVEAICSGTGVGANGTYLPMAKEVRRANSGPDGLCSLYSPRKVKKESKRPVTDCSSKQVSPSLNS